METKPKDIFISYCRRDIEKVKRIKQEIEAETQAQCWMDLEGIESGNQKFTKMIIRAINSCSIFLFMLSEASQQSENALKELDFAYKKHREEGKKVAIVYIEPCKMNDEFSFDYGKADTIDWQNPLQREKLIRNLKAWTNYEAKLAETHQEKERLALAEAEAQQRAEEARKRREEEAQRKAEAEQRRKAELEKEKQKEQTAALFAKCISPFRKMKKSAIGWIVGIGAMIFLIFWGISQCSTPQIGIGTLEGHTSYVYSASFSPDGSRIVSASQDSTVRIWNAATGECIRTLEGHAGGVPSASFSPDGSRIMSASYDNTVRIWDISDLTNFIKKAVDDLDNQISLYNYDLVVMPESSSKVNQYMLRYIYRFAQPSLHKMELVKALPASISFDMDAYEKQYLDDVFENGLPRYTPAQKEDVKFSINKMLDLIHQKDYFTIAKDVKKSRFRPYMMHFLRFATKADEELCASIRKQNVLIIDDVTTSGSTLNEILRTLRILNEDNEITIFSLIGRKDLMVEAF